MFDLRSCATALLVIGAVGCSGEVETYAADADTGSTHALVSVERRVTLDDQTSRAGAVAGFVRMPAHVDAESLLTLVGLGLDLPEPGKCTSASSRPSTPLSPLRDIALLQAGDVTLQASGVTTRLAPRAFPTVADSISGVVYTTRDRSADVLPAGVRYSVSISGGPDLTPVAVTADAPGALEAVTIGGVQLSEVSSVSTSQPIDLTWSVGASGDLVYAQLVGADGKTAAVCSFRDDQGAGTINAGFVSALGDGYLSLHRVRVREFAAPGVDRGQLRFDFELAANVSYVE